MRLISEKKNGRMLKKLAQAIFSLLLYFTGIAIASIFMSILSFTFFFSMNTHICKKIKDTMQFMLFGNLFFYSVYHGYLSTANKIIEHDVPYF